MFFHYTNIFVEKTIFLSSMINVGMLHSSLLCFLGWTSPLHMEDFIFPDMTITLYFSRQMMALIQSS